MKNAKGYLKILCFLIIAAILASGVQSQEYTRDFSADTRLNEINPQAFRHFKKNFPTVSNEYWYKTESGFVVKYMENKILSQSYYDNRGAFIYNVKYVEEKDLDKEVIYRINREFPGYVIDVASEVKSDMNIMYFLSLKNKMKVKNIMVTDMELKVIEDILYASR
jgi:hypothetical protein